MSRSFKYVGGPRSHFRRMVTPRKPCVCGAHRPHKERFCLLCSQRLPAELLENLKAAEPKAGGAAWTAAYAACENWLQANPRSRGLR